MPKIEIKNVYKIFGNSPTEVLPMVKSGANKEEVLEKTGDIVKKNTAVVLEKTEIQMSSDHYEREKRKRNIIIRHFPESRMENPEERKQYDLNFLKGNVQWV